MSILFSYKARKGVKSSALQNSISGRLAYKLPGNHSKTNTDRVEQTWKQDIHLMIYL